MKNIFEIIYDWFTASKRLGKLKEEILALETDWISIGKLKVSILLEDKELTTEEIAKKIKKSRSYTARILNALEKEGKVKEVGRIGKRVLYRRCSHYEQ